MHSLLFAISLAALFSTTSLIVVLFRVSPLLAPLQAVPAFFVSLGLSVSTLSTLLLFLAWKQSPVHWDFGKMISISLRQGVFLGMATSIMVLFHLLGLLTWWIALFIFGVFLLVELALDH